MEGFDSKQHKRIQERLRQLDRSQPAWRIVNDMNQTNRVQNYQAKQKRPRRLEHRIVSQDNKFKTLQLPEDVFRKSHNTLLLKSSFDRRLGLQSQQGPKSLMQPAQNSKSQIMLSQQNSKFLLKQNAYKQQQNMQQRAALQECLIQKDYRECDYLFRSPQYSRIKNSHTALPDLHSSYLQYKRDLKYNCMSQSDNLQVRQLKLLDKHRL